MISLVGFTLVTSSFRHSTINVSNIYKAAFSSQHNENTNYNMLEYSIHFSVRFQFNNSTSCYAQR